MEGGAEWGHCWTGSVETLAGRGTYGTLELTKCKTALNQAELSAYLAGTSMQSPHKGALTDKTNTKDLRKSPFFTWWLWKKTLFVVLCTLTIWAGSSYSVLKSSSDCFLTRYVENHFGRATASGMQNLGSEILLSSRLFLS